MQSMNNSIKANASEIKPFELAIIARGTARLTIPELAAMRKQPPACFSPKLAPLFLKHSDEQTLAALAALYRAKADFGLDAEDFGPWGVVSISRYLGRGAFASMRDRFAVDGAWGVSVQLIPHRTAHSTAGTISLGLGMHGPCIGVNGGMDGENSGLLALPCLMQSGQCRGTWLVLSNWSPELTVDQKGQSVSDSVCMAAALALSHADHPNPLGHIRFMPTGQAENESSVNRVSKMPETSLLEYLFADDDHAAWQRCPGSAMRVEVELSVPAGVVA
jgi:hypothetical protein